MRIIVFGLTISSAWGNGHATLWRGLARALAKAGCRITFFERDTDYYAAHRDFLGSDDVDLMLYRDWATIEPIARGHMQDADVSIVTSFCRDGAAAAELPVRGGHVRVLYDLDTPVTLDRLGRGGQPDHLGLHGLAPFDLVLSFTGGGALDRLREFGASRVGTLYGFADPREHRPVPGDARYAADLGFLGTWAADRQSGMVELLVEPARREPSRRFLIGGAQYPDSFPWEPNIFFVHHVPPSEHGSFFSSGRLSLNLTRGVMKRWGWCPSGRLFEAAACGAAIVSDHFEGIEAFFEPGREIIVATGASDVTAALELSQRELDRIAAAGRERMLVAHTADHRAAELLAAIEDCRGGRPDTSGPAGPLTIH
jgi:spore maturation protein CgeB